MHSTDNLEDGYLGSGKILGYSRAKHGDENHKKEIVEMCPDREALKLREKEIVNEVLLANPLNINLKYGGEGGFEHQNLNAEVQRAKGIKGNKRMRVLRETDPEWVAKTSQKITTGLKTAYSSGRVVTGCAVGDGLKEMSKRSQTSEAWEKRKATWADRAFQQGEKNSQFGTCWIHNSIHAKRIKKTELENYLAQGYVKGAKFKF
jgi:hypothetical protein